MSSIITSAAVCKLQIKQIGIGDRNANHQIAAIGTALPVLRHKVLHKRRKAERIVDFDIHAAGKAQFVFKVGAAVSAVIKVIAEIAFQMKFYAFPQRIIVSYAYFPSGFGIGGAVGHVVFFNQRDIQLFNIGAVKKLITAFAAKGLSQRGVFVFLKFGLIAEAGKRPDVGFMPAEAFLE